MTPLHPLRLSVGLAVGLVAACGSTAGADAPNPHVQLGPTRVVGSVDPDIVHRIIRAHVNEVRHCYGRALEQDPTLTGEVVLALTLNGRKTVSHSSIASSTLDHARTEICISTAAARWAFAPSGDGEPVEVRQSMRLRPG